MESLSSAPRNRNGNKLLSAAFAIAASISGSVNAATTPAPKFTDEPAGSPKILDVAKAQQAILDMLPADHKSRPGIAAAIKTLEDGGSVQELTALFIWAKTIVDNPMAPPAAKEKAKEIVTLLTQNEKQGDIIPENSVDNGGVNSEPLPPTGTSKPKTSPPKIDMLTEKEMKERAITHFGPGSKLDGRPWTTNEWSTCKKVSFWPNWELDIGDSGYLQISQTLEKKDLPKEFEAFCESRMWLIVKVNYYDDKEKKLLWTFTVPANGEWTAAEKVPTKCTRAVIFVFITANDSNNWQKLPEINLRKPKKK